MDLRGNQLAAVFGAYQPASGVLYLYDEYLAEGTPDEHLEAIIRRCQRCSETEGVIDPTANGREQRDGSGLIQIYRRTGMDWIAVNAPLESGIVAVSQCMGSGRLRVFNHLVNFMQQLRHYRRDDQGRVLAGDDALLDATRCLVTGALPRIRRQIERSRISQLFDEGPIYRGPDSWMA